MVISADRRQALLPVRLFAVFLLFTAFLLVSSQQSASGGHLEASSRKGLAFSQRGLANANRLSASRARSGQHATLGDATESASLDDFILSDLIIVSTVEGGVYGLDRETGKTLWKLDPRASGSPSRNGTSGFGPLVGTSYGPKHRSFADMAADLPLIDAPSTWDGQSPLDGSSGKESLDALQELGLYIVEPSSGQVFVLTTPAASSTSTGSKATLSKLPLTLPQLVELSPFSFPGDASRVFVGHKSTSLVEIDVRSGKVGAVFGGGGQGGEGVWCTDDGKEGDKNETCAQDPSKEWAYMGRTDYTLSIHLRGRPALSQTLHFSTFAPNAADRDIASLWLRRGESPDHRAIMGMPEEGTLLCFDASLPASSPRQQQERTLWIRELGATVAGIFDVVYPESLLDEGKYQPLVLPHPGGTLHSLFGDLPSPFKGRTDTSMEAVMQRDQAAYLGIADGQLYAMDSQEYPLVAFTPRAPAGFDGDEEKFYEHHSRGASSCASYGCLLGSYDLHRASGESSSTDELLGLGPGHSPLLGIGDGTEETDKGSTKGQSNDNTSAKQPKLSDAQRSSISAWMTPTMIMYQIIALFLLACLCGLVYIGGSELQRQRAEDARAATRNVVWAPLSESSGVGKSTTNNDKAKGIGLSTDKQDESKVVEPDDKISTEAVHEKKKPARRRRRGKRAGAAVAQRDIKRDESKSQADEESEDDDGGLDADKEDAKEHENGIVLTTEESIAAEPNLIDLSPGSEDQLAGLSSKAALSAAEGGKHVALTNGESAAVRGEDRSLVISEDVLGYGSSGTVVFKGTFQGRAVAVKRLLRDFVDVAAKEVSLLESADNHANVIRYFYKEITDSFLFIALELCPASLSDIVEKPREYQELSASLKPKRALFQITSGLQHLHSLSIVHRDIKPQNILVSHSANGQLKMLLSDFGLSKRLDGVAQTSFSQTVNNPGGTFGWRAPEILRGEVMLGAAAGDNGSSSLSTIASLNSEVEGSRKAEEKKRLTRAVDIFALGCLFYYLLSNGDHPFGSRFEREMNILKRQIDLSRLDGLGEEGHEAQHLIMMMIAHEPNDRPSGIHAMAHPYFWDAGRRLAFLQDASDRFDIMERDPPAAPLVSLEENASSVLGQDWHRRVDRQVMEDLNKRRRYDPKSVAALLRAIRNKKHHIHDVPPNVRRLFTAAGGFSASQNGAEVTASNSTSAGNLTHSVQLLPDGFLAYFTSRFPKLFLHTYEVVDSFDVLKTESSFAPYFKPVRDEV